MTSEHEKAQQIIETTADAWTAAANWLRAHQVDLADCGVHVAPERYGSPPALLGNAEVVTAFDAPPYAVVTIFTYEDVPALVQRLIDRFEGDWSVDTRVYGGEYVFFERVFTSLRLDDIEIECRVPVKLSVQVGRSAAAQIPVPAMSTKEGE